MNGATMNGDAAHTLGTAWASAKVNLYLHVGPPGAGGLHPVDSLVVFADWRAADRITARRFPQVALRLEGTQAKALRREPNNLSVAAASTLREACGLHGLGAELTLYKELPVAAGIGGGSADAAATMHVLNSLWSINFGEAALENIARQLGADVPACVRSRPVVMRGAGELLEDAVCPSLEAVLVNPGVKLETRRVFERFDKLGGRQPFAETSPPASTDAGEFVASLARDYRNDLQPAAISLCSEIEKVLEALRGQKGCLMARMSGSGPTCFGIFESAEAADAAASAIAARKRKYWVKATTFRGAGPGVV
ncbi:MAG: 4-(cytidine 5'-diphospho)-2-C-methyl-D-erythritol kinase [Hyphomonadaceae bacterium]